MIVLEGMDRDIYVMWSTGALPVQFSITSNVEGETAALIAGHDAPGTIVSGLVDWPAAFSVEVPPARRDANGFLTIAGSPVMLALDRDEAFVRVTYVGTNGTWVRLR